MASARRARSAGARAPAVGSGLVSVSVNVMYGPLAEELAIWRRSWKRSSVPVRGCGTSDWLRMSGLATVTAVLTHIKTYVNALRKRYPRLLWINRFEAHITAYCLTSHQICRLETSAPHLQRAIFASLKRNFELPKKETHVIMDNPYSCFHV